jgi:transposase
MVNYKEILRLAAEGYSQRQIAASVRSSRNKVNEVIVTAKNVGISCPLDESVTNEQIEAILFPERYSTSSMYLEPDYFYIHNELAKRGVTLTLLWNEYVQKAESLGKKPYMTTQFGDKYRSWARITKATMRIQHKPGDAMQVDWAGDTLSVYDSMTGEITPAYLFIAVLPCSCYVYAEAAADMKLENWLNCHVHAYEYFGGVTRLLIPDNLKTGVTKNNRYETVLNRSYQELAEYYDTAIVPARVEHPKDKSLAEGSVKFASTWILAALRNERFFTLNEAREAVRQKLEELNLREFKQREGCRRSAYLDEEKAFMKPLPSQRYELATWNPNIKVGTDYLVSDGRNKYSVPFDLIGEKVDIRLTSTTVEVFFHGSRVASHVRKTAVQREPIVNENHMTPEHRKYLNYNTEDFTVWAKSVGESTMRVVTYFLTAGKEPEQGYKSCASLTKLAEKYGAKKLETACADVLKHTSAPSLRLISTILKNGIIKPEEEKPEVRRNSNAYGITRGAAYYSKRGKDGESK